MCCSVVCGENIAWCYCRWRAGSTGGSTLWLMVTCCRPLGLQDGARQVTEDDGVHSVTCWPVSLQILCPLKVTLGPGDALVWFPGWEHETGIETGPSISLSLHFLSDPASHYLHTFRDLLSSRVSNSCNWGHAHHSDSAS